MHNYKTIIGIDNGLDGGCCAIDAKTNKILGCLVMPCTVYENKREILADEVYAWCAQFPKPLIAVEEPLHFSRSIQSMRSMAISFGKLLGTFAVMQVPLTRVLVRPWQTEMLGTKIGKGLTKVVALAKARERWPKQKWILGKLKEPHDGVIDAALIATYINENYIPKPIKAAGRARAARAKKVAI